jgi:hypothetical protein
MSIAQPTGVGSGSGAPAAGADAGTLFVDLLPWLLLLLGVVVVGWIVILWVRRSLRAEVGHTKGFSLEDLRSLHRDGSLSDEEYESAKRTLLARRPSRDELVAQLRPQSKPIPKRPDRGG